jgi:hypothetical protein
VSVAASQVLTAATPALIAPSTVHAPAEIAIKPLRPAITPDSAKPKPASVIKTPPSTIPATAVAASGNHESLVVADERQRRLCRRDRQFDQRLQRIGQRGPRLKRDGARTPL